MLERAKLKCVIVCERAEERLREKRKRVKERERARECKRMG